MLKTKPILISFIYKGRNLVFLSSVILISVFYILFVLRPNEVNLDEQRFSYAFTCFIQSIIPILLLYTVSVCIPQKLKSENKWNVLYEFILVFSVMLMASFCNFLVRDLIYINDHNWSTAYLYEELANGLKIGIVVSALTVALRIVLELIINLKKANQLQSNLTTEVLAVEAHDDSEITVQGPVKSEKFQINPRDLIYAKSAGNYVDIYIQEHEEIKKLTKRLTLSSFLTYFHKQNKILRIHNSYVANLDKIKQVSGNAAGLTLKFQNLADTSIPVSRKYIKRVEGVLQN